MSKEQIEEMAKILIDYKNKNHIMASTAILADYAEELYNAGYRKKIDGDGLLLTFDGATGYFPKEFIIEAIKTHMKQSEVAREIFEDLENFRSQLKYYGFGYTALGHKLAELKKKYTEV